MARRDWDKARVRQQVKASTRAAIDAHSYTRELFESHRRAEDYARHGARPDGAQPSKAAMRAQAVKAVAAWELEHPPSEPLPPWGPWSQWRTVTRADGSTYRERDRSRVRP